MSRALSDLIGPIGNQQHQQKLSSLLYSVKDKVSKIESIFIVGLWFFTVQIAAIFLSTAARLEWTSKTIESTLLSIFNSLGMFSAEIRNLQDLDYLVYSLLLTIVAFTILLFCVIFFSLNENELTLTSIVPFAAPVVGMQIIIMPATFTMVSYIFSGHFYEKWFQFAISIFILLIALASTLLEYFVRFGVPRKVAIWNTRTVIFRYVVSVFYFIGPNFNIYLTNMIPILVLNGISLAVCLLYLYFQIRLSHSLVFCSYSLATLVGNLLNIIIVFIKISGETYITFYLIMLNMAFVLLLLITYFTSEYVLIPLRESIQTHNYRLLDKYAISTLEDIVSYGITKMEIPNELLDYLESRAPDSIIFNEIIFLFAEETVNETRMRKALENMLIINRTDLIHQVRLCHFEDLIRPTFMSIRAQMILNDYSNTLGMLWNEIVNDNTEHLLSLANVVSKNYLTLTNIFNTYGKQNKLSKTYSRFCEITRFNSESESNNMTYALVSCTGNKNENSSVNSHCTQYIIIYIAFLLYTFNFIMHTWAKNELEALWDASFDAYHILQAVNAGSFIVTLMKLGDTINITTISQDVYNDILFPSKLTNLTEDLDFMLDTIELYSTLIKKYANSNCFNGIIYNWLISSLNVTRVSSTVESALGYVASSYQSVLGGNTPYYQGLYISGTTDLIIYAQIFDHTITELRDYAVTSVRYLAMWCRIQMVVFMVLAPILLLIFSHFLKKSVSGFFQPLFKLSKADLIQKTRELMTWVKDMQISQSEDNNVKYNKELILSKTHTNSVSNTSVQIRLFLTYTILFLIFIVHSWVFNEVIMFRLLENADDLRTSSYAFLLPQQMLKIGQLFLLATRDVVYEGEEILHLSAVISLLSIQLNILQEQPKFHSDKLEKLSKIFQIKESKHLAENLGITQQTESEGTCPAKHRKQESFFEHQEFRRKVLESDVVNQSATLEIRTKHEKNLLSMINIVRRMVEEGNQKFAQNAPNVIDPSLYISSSPTLSPNIRSLFPAVEVSSLTIYDAFHTRSNDTTIYDTIVSNVIIASTLYAARCESSLIERLDISTTETGFLIAFAALCSIASLAIMYGIVTALGTYWIPFDIINKSIISTMPKFDTINGRIEESITLSTREEEMKKSSAIVVDIMNSQDAREELLENHLLLDSRNIIIRSSIIVEDLLSADDLQGLRFDDVMKNLAIILPNDSTAASDVDKIIFKPKDDKKKDIVLEALKFKVPDIELDCGIVSSVCIIRDKTREYEAMKLWRNELNQLKLLALQFIPPAVYESLTGQESFNTIQINSAFIATFYITKYSSVQDIETIKAIITRETSGYQHIWPVGRSLMCVHIYSAILEQNISHFKSLITLLYCSLKIAKSITDMGCEPHCVISKVKATNASFGLDSPPVFDMRDDNPYELILAMGSPPHKISISRDPYEILYNTGIPIEFSFYFRSEGFHKISYDTLPEIETIIEREQVQMAIA